MIFYMNQVISALQFGLVWMLICGATFTLFAVLMPGNTQQKILRKGLLPDIGYWFLCHSLYSQMLTWIIAGLVFVFIHDSARWGTFMTHGFGVFSGLSIFAQLVIVFIVYDLMQYGTHRLFHQKLLWNFHAIHHSSVDLDWLSGTRFHPFNLFIHSVMVGMIVFFLGFDPLVFVIIGPFNIFYSALVHSNVNWTFGPLRYIVASPVYHRWHHTSPAEGGEKNFAPTFPVIDYIFGTFYMPKGEFPTKFGVLDPVPKTLYGQLVYPFRKS